VALRDLLMLVSGGLNIGLAVGIFIAWCMLDQAAKKANDCSNGALIWAQRARDWEQMYKTGRSRLRSDRRGSCQEQAKDCDHDSEEAAAEER